MMNDALGALSKIMEGQWGIMGLGSRVEYKACNKTESP